jgi:hypothetical protein
MLRRAVILVLLQVLVRQKYHLLCWDLIATVDPIARKDIDGSQCVSKLPSDP